MLSSRSTVVTKLKENRLLSLYYMNTVKCYQSTATPESVLVTNKSRSIKEPRVYLLCQYSQPEVSLEEALKALRAYSLCERPETVDVSLKCNLKEKAQQPRGTLKLPHNFGSGMKILAFAEEPDASQALKAGARIAGGTELVKQIQNDGLPDVDLCVSTPSMMSEVKKLQKILRAKMPIDRRGTVGSNLEEIIQSFLGSREFKGQRNYVNMAVGKLNFTEDQIRDNIQVVIEAVLKHRGTRPKSNFIDRIVLSSTYGPGFKLKKTF